MSPILPKIQSGAFIVKLAVAGTILSLGIILNLSDLLILNLVGIILIGLMYAHAVELQHQCLHHTAFNSRRANRIVGVILGLPMLASFHAYRKAHLEHHRKLGTSGDQEFFSYRLIKDPTISNFAYDLFGVAQLISFWRGTRQKLVILNFIFRFITSYATARIITEQMQALGGLHDLNAYPRFCRRTRLCHAHRCAKSLCH